MFDNLSQKFNDVFKRLSGKSKLTEDNIKEVCREVRLALLEADVNFKVAKRFVQVVQERALGHDVIRGVNPAQQFTHIVHLELIRMLGGDPPEEEQLPSPAPEAVEGEADAAPEAETPTEEPATDAEAETPEEAPAPVEPISPFLKETTEPEKPFVVQPGKSNIILLLGLQGSGKTTFSGKLAQRLLKKKCSPLLVACDIYRPAAVEQLKVVSKSVGVPCFEMGIDHTPNEIIRGAQKQAKASGNDVLIVDTAGRLHIDDVKMDELRDIKKEFNPDYTFLVCDAMTGQDAVTSASAFDGEVGLDGVCLTKMDSDARGGAALSVRAVTGKPIVFIGTGERPEDLDEFVPDRIASRILGMGDVVSLVEKAQEAMDTEQVMEMRDKIATRKFDFNDFLKQMRMVKKMGSFKGMLGMIPGMGQMMGEVDDDEMENELKRVEAIIYSMTKEERENDELLRKNGRRRDRIAKGSGTTLQEVTELIRQFDQAKDMMQSMMGAGMMGGAGAGGGGGIPGAGMLGSIKNLLGGGGGGGLPPGMMPPGMGGGGELPPGFPTPPGMPQQPKSSRSKPSKIRGGHFMKKKSAKKKKKKHKKR